MGKDVLWLSSWWVWFLFGFSSLLVSVIFLFSTEQMLKVNVEHGPVVTMQLLTTCKMHSGVSAKRWIICHFLFTGVFFFCWKQALGLFYLFSSKYKIDSQTLLLIVTGLQVDSGISTMSFFQMCNSQSFILTAIKTKKEEEVNQTGHSYLMPHKITVFQHFGNGRSRFNPWTRSEVKTYCRCCGFSVFFGLLSVSE